MSGCEEEGCKGRLREREPLSAPTPTPRWRLALGASLLAPGGRLPNLRLPPPGHFRRRAGVGGRGGRLSRAGPESPRGGAASRAGSRRPVRSAAPPPPPPPPRLPRPPPPLPPLPPGSAPARTAPAAAAAARGEAAAQPGSPRPARRRRSRRHRSRPSPRRAHPPGHTHPPPGASPRTAPAAPPGARAGQMRRCAPLAPGPTPRSACRGLPARAPRAPASSGSLPLLGITPEAPAVAAKFPEETRLPGRCAGKEGFAGRGRGAQRAGRGAGAGGAGAGSARGRGGRGLPGFALAPWGPRRLWDLGRGSPSRQPSAGGAGPAAGRSGCAGRSGVRGRRLHSPELRLERAGARTEPQPEPLAAPPGGGPARRGVPGWAGWFQFRPRTQKPEGLGLGSLERGSRRPRFGVPVPTNCVSHGWNEVLFLKRLRGGHKQPPTSLRARRGLWARCGPGWAVHRALGRGTEPACVPGQRAPTPARGQAHAPPRAAQRPREGGWAEPGDQRSPRRKL